MKRMYFIGEGGMGVQIVAELFCRCAIKTGKYATMIKAYGPEARGSKSSNIVTIDDEPITEIIHNKFDILVAFSEKDYEENKSIADKHIFNKEYKSNINYLVDILHEFNISNDIAIRFYREKLEKKSMENPLLKQKYEEGMMILENKQRT